LYKAKLIIKKIVAKPTPMTKTMGIICGATIKVAKRGGTSKSKKNIANIPTINLRTLKLLPLAHLACKGIKIKIHWKLNLMNLPLAFSR
jgi:hypothetical protein